MGKCLAFPPQKCYNIMKNYHGRDYP
jgi:hypothetical protein